MLLAVKGGFHAQFNVEILFRVCSGLSTLFLIELGSPGVSQGLICIESATDGGSLIRIDFFGLVLAGLSKAPSLFFFDPRTDGQAD